MHPSGSLRIFVPTTKEGVKACYNPYSCVQISNCVRSQRNTLLAVAEESSVSMGRNLAMIQSERRIGMSKCYKLQLIYSWLQERQERDEPFLLEAGPGLHPHFR